jgi:hypothetical protein
MAVADDNRLVRRHAAAGGARNLPPAGFEQRNAAMTMISGSGLVPARARKAADRLYAPRLERERPANA